jgi:MFS family permease
VTRLRASRSPFQRLRDLRAEFDRAVWVLAIGDLVASFGFSLIFPFLTIYLTAELGATAGQAGLILGLYAIVSIGSNAAGGWLADRVGRKAVMVVSITLTAIVIAMMGLVRDLAWIALLTLLLGLVDPPFIPAARAAVADVVPEPRRPRAYGLLGVAASIGWIAGPSIGAGLSGFGYGLLFLASGVIVGAYALILLVAFRETKPDLRREAPRAAALVAGDPGMAAATTGLAEARAGPDPDPPAVGYDPPQGRAAMGLLLHGRERWLVFGAFLVFAVAIHATAFQWVVTLPIHAYGDLGLSTATWGLLFALNGIMILAFQLRITSAAERRNRPRFMAVGALWYALGYLVVALIPGAELAAPALAATVVLVTIGEMCIYPIEPSFVSELSPPARRGRDQGLLGAAIGLGTAIGPVAGGAILELAPGPPLWLVTATVCAATAAGLWWLGGRTARIQSRPVPA